MSLITSIKEAIKNPTILDNNKIKSQQTRQILDRIIGYLLSPLLARIEGIEDKCDDCRKLGTGRVQWEVTKLIIDKENEINN